MNVVIKYDDSWVKEIDPKCSISDKVWTGDKHNALILDVFDSDFEHIVSDLADDGFLPLIIEEA